MYSTTIRENQVYLPGYGRMYYENDNSAIDCNWQALRKQLLEQWTRLAKKEIDKAGPNRHRLAVLIEQKYGVSQEMIENYLRNFERTMPLMAHQ